MSKSIKGDPVLRIGHIIAPPPGIVMPPMNGFTPFWEKELGLVYVTNKEARRIDLSVGYSIRFEIQSASVPRKTNVTIVQNISNV